MATLTVGRLLGSVLLSLVTIVLVATIVSLVVLDQFEPRSAGALAGALAVYLLGFAGIAWRRLSGEYGFVAAEGPEGVSIRRGLFQTVSETIPYGRIQAVRQVEPWLWRPLGWCRLEVDIAGATSRNQRGEGSGVVRKALLPVGSQADSWHLIARLLGGPDPPRTAPPRVPAARLPSATTSCRPATTRPTPSASPAASTSRRPGCRWRSRRASDGSRVPHSACSDWRQCTWTSPGEGRGPSSATAAFPRPTRW